MLRPDMKRCAGITKLGKSCKRLPKNGSVYCAFHDREEPSIAYQLAITEQPIETTEGIVNRILEKLKDGPKTPRQLIKSRGMKGGRNDSSMKRRNALALAETMKLVEYDHITNTWRLYESNNDSSSNCNACSSKRAQAS